MQDDLHRCSLEALGPVALYQPGAPALAAGCGVRAHVTFAGPARLESAAGGEAGTLLHVAPGGARVVRSTVEVLA